MHLSMLSPMGGRTGNNRGFEFLLYCFVKYPPCQPKSKRPCYRRAFSSNNQSTYCGYTALINKYYQEKYNDQTSCIFN